jgi:hypothetical protein
MREGDEGGLGTDFLPSVVGAMSTTEDLGRHQSLSIRQNIYLCLLQQFQRGDRWNTKFQSIKTTIMRDEHSRLACNVSLDLKISIRDCTERSQDCTTMDERKDGCNALSGTNTTGLHALTPTLLSPQLSLQPRQLTIFAALNPLPHNPRQFNDLLPRVLRMQTHPHPRFCLGDGRIRNGAHEESTRDEVGR